MTNQLSKVQWMSKVLYVVEQMLLWFEVNIVSVWCYVHGFIMVIMLLTARDTIEHGAYILDINVIGLLQR